MYSVGPSSKATALPLTFSNWFRALCAGLLCLAVIACGGG